LQVRLLSGAPVYDFCTAQLDFSARDYSGLIPANLITLPRFSVSSAISSVKSAGRKPVGRGVRAMSSKAFGGALSFPSVGMLRPRLRPLGITLDGLDDLIKRRAQRYRRALQFRQEQSALDGR
jgi:hypothetical protein